MSCKSRGANDVERHVSTLTDQRGSMKEDTMKALLVIKNNSSMEFTDNSIVRLKSCYRLYHNPLGLGVYRPDYTCTFGVFFMPK